MKDSILKEGYVISNLEKKENKFNPGLLDKLYRRKDLLLNELDKIEINFNMELEKISAANMENNI